MGRIEVDQEVCKGCELCTIPCPHELVRMSNRFNRKGYRTSEQADPQKQCTGCALCAQMCPDLAITVYR